ncbi:hypothetical protein [Desulfovibrio cuneatus]|uniref:hypothetical protein n=1 Tax=Desulfovibrio cuneatus TaxID=159728 RepID=UPI00040CD929|nr:hypothetical protein [Desulfovibrio cuneatus]
MALQIPGGGEQGTWLGKGPAVVGRGQQLPQESTQARDAKGVFALSLVAEGESALKKMLEEEMRPGQEGFAARAQQKIQVLASRATDRETRNAVEQQLAGTLEAVSLRHRDVTVRKHLDGCMEQLERRKVDVETNMTLLADTAMNSPDAALRAEAKKAAAQQAALLHRAQGAMLAAGMRYGLTPQIEKMLGGSTAAETASPVTAGNEQGNGVPAAQALANTPPGSAVGTPVNDPGHTVLSPAPQGAKKTETKQ